LFLILHLYIHMFTNKMHFDEYRALIDQM
jgi:hypothetical protein